MVLSLIMVVLLYNVYINMSFMSISTLLLSCKFINKRQATHKAWFLKRPNKKASPITIAVPFECVYNTKKCCLGRQLTAFWGIQYSVCSSIFVLYLPWSKCVLIGSMCPSNRAQLWLFSGSADHSAVTSDTSSCKNNLQPTNGLHRQCTFKNCFLTITFWISIQSYLLIWL